MVADLLSLLKFLPHIGVGLFIFIFLMILLNPEKIEKWSAMLWRLLSMCGRMFRGAHKKL
jgi:hypothetical protein